MSPAGIWLLAALLTVGAGFCAYVIVRHERNAALDRIIEANSAADERATLAEYRAAAAERREAQLRRDVDDLLKTEIAWGVAHDHYKSATAYRYEVSDEILRRAGAIGPKATAETIGRWMLGKIVEDIFGNRLAKREAAERTLRLQGPRDRLP